MTSKTFVDGITVIDAAWAQDVNDHVYGLSPLAGQGNDDTVYFQTAVDTHKTLHVPKGNYNITTVDIGVYGCDIRFDKEAVITVTGAGFQRELEQTPRATFIANNSLLDDTNYYYTMRITGGTFLVGANATATSDRVPFLVYTGVAPSPAHAGIPLQRPIVVRDSHIVLTDSTSIGIGIHGGWGATVEDCTIDGYDCGTGIDIGGSSADGDISCQPQEVLVYNTHFNSCDPFDSAKGGCTNSCEGLTVTNCYFNFVQLSNLDTINDVRWVNNLLVTHFDSLLLTDCSNTTIADSYFESNSDPTDSNNPGIVNCHNCSDLKVVNNAFLVQATATATARDGILIKSNSSNAMTGVLVQGNRFLHATYNATLETNAIRFATAGGSGQILNIICKDNICDEWHNAVNFTDHITSLATNVDISGITNNNGVTFLKGVARVDTSSLRAVGLYEKITLVVSGTSVGGALTTAVGSAFHYTPMLGTPTVSVTNYTDISNSDSITAGWATYGENTVHIALLQDVASAAGDLVQASATITIDGTSV